MSRPLRIEYPNAWYHVMNRGRRGENIFHDKQDYQMFVDLLVETTEMWNFRISAYCLMPNHYHILLTRRLRHDSLQEIGTQFQVKKYSSVSSIGERMKDRIGTDRRVKKCINELCALISIKSQEQT